MKRKYTAPGEAAQRVSLQDSISSQDLQELTNLRLHIWFQAKLPYLWGVLTHRVLKVELCISRKLKPLKVCSEDCQAHHSSPT